uniref:hypothetical protein n=1 Tax=Phymatolithon calcareum TaxID=1277942 RepID=UPI0023F41294|nr:hypothetical protein P6G74_pgp078 [Phymatolithon calcareum]WEA76935.1 hypothetical protein [Phymatolithon calcareum]
MNSKFLASKIAGNWIIQSTTYSLLKNKILTSTNQINWKPVENKNSNNILKLLLKNIIEKHDTNNSSIYILESKNNTKIEKFYKFFLYNEKLNKGYLLKLNHSGNILSKSEFTYKSNQHLYINHNNNGFYIDENIYFINQNLKIVKSIIKKNNECIGISFSSEIKMS